mmetsp:Transcript_53339/g.108502  ORF Transcript_53339/g.108502 Transcript_53339/m.108502 type:complete len:220 (-) Transcript_53339:553-1212(-)
MRLPSTFWLLQRHRRTPRAKSACPTICAVIWRQSWSCWRRLTRTRRGMIAMPPVASMEVTPGCGAACACRLESPLAKVECLDRVLNTVCAAAEGKSDDTVDTAFTDRAPPSRHTLARKRTGKHGRKAAEVRAVSSDDLLPLVMWTVVLASTPKPVAAWWANVQYLHTYLPDPGGRRGYVWCAHACWSSTPHNVVAARGNRVPDTQFLHHHNDGVLGVFA